MPQNPNSRKSEIHQAQQIYRILCHFYPDLDTELYYENVYQLYVAVLLSAQCTDKRVNIITPQLFAAYSDPDALSKAQSSQLEAIIKSCGLYQTKSKNLILGARKIVNEFQGKVPERREQLESLPGIGRKSASVILAVGFQQNAFPVDTHVGRLSRRLGWSKHQNPLKVEQDVTSLFQPPQWLKLHHALILHGRRICQARKAQCDLCPINQLCPRQGL